MLYIIRKHFYIYTSIVGEMVDGWSDIDQGILFFREENKGGRRRKEREKEKKNKKNSEAGCSDCF